jgi:hypothetical protein
VKTYDVNSETLMRTYLEEVVAKARLELIEELAYPDMVDEANQAFSGPPGERAWWHRLGISLPTTRRTLDVSEQKRHRPQRSHTHTSQHSTPLGNTAQPTPET